MDKYDYWLTNIKDDNIVSRLREMTTEERGGFDGYLRFGTSGMRGVMALGTAYINELTVCKLAQAVATYICAHFTRKRAVVCYDTRHNSREYSRLFAKVLERNGVDVVLFKNFAPTPLCVYATVRMRADMGVMITASHNERQYNGIKVYTGEGLSIGADIQGEISATFDEVDEVSVYNDSYDYRLKRVEYIDKDIQDEFVDRLQIRKSRSLRIVYSPLHGTGYYAVKRLFEQNGFAIAVPSEQKKADGDFPTCPYPNPEFDETFVESIALAQKRKADIIVMTDPDADRLGVAVRDKGEYRRLSGDEVGYILAYYALSHSHKFVVTTVVTSPLIDKICEYKQAHLYKTLTGFVHIGARMAECIAEYGAERFGLAYEESCGYIVRSDQLDKDGIFASLKICEIADGLKARGKTLVDYLEEIYSKVGYMSVLRDNKIVSSSALLGEQIDALRERTLREISGYPITRVVDYMRDDTGLARQNFLRYEGEDFSFILRPSGTEPKLKIYIFVAGERGYADAKAREILDGINKLVE